MHDKYNQTVTRDQINNIIGEYACMNNNQVIHVQQTFWIDILKVKIGITQLYITSLKVRDVSYL